jgi:hypothetical protein
MSVRVKAKNETLAKYLKHPSKIGFSPDGTSTWPNDQFTKRRIRDGDITVMEEAAVEPAAEPAKTEPATPKADEKRPLHRRASSEQTAS